MVSGRESKRVQTIEGRPASQVGADLLPEGLELLGSLLGLDASTRPCRCRSRGSSGPRPVPWCSSRGRGAGRGPTGRRRRPGRGRGRASGASGHAGLAAEVGLLQDVGNVAKEDGSGCGCCLWGRRWGLARQADEGDNEEEGSGEGSLDHGVARGRETGTAVQRWTLLDYAKRGRDVSSEPAVRNGTKGGCKLLRGKGIRNIGRFRDLGTVICATVDGHRRQTVRRADPKTVADARYSSPVGGLLVVLG